MATILPPSPRLEITVGAVTSTESADLAKTDGMTAYATHSNISRNMLGGVHEKINPALVASNFWDVDSLTGPPIVLAAYRDAAHANDHPKRTIRDKQNGRTYWWNSVSDVAATVHRHPSRDYHEPRRRRNNHRVEVEVPRHLHFWDGLASDAKHKIEVARHAAELRAQMLAAGGANDDKTDPALAATTSRNPYYGPHDARGAKTKAEVMRHKADDDKTDPALVAGTYWVNGKHNFLFAAHSDAAQDMFSGGGANNDDDKTDPASLVAGSAWGKIGLGKAAQRARRVSEEVERAADEAIMGEQITYRNGGVYDKTDPALVALSWGEIIPHAKKNFHPKRDLKRSYKRSKHRSVFATHRDTAQANDDDDKTDPASLVAGSAWGKIGLGKAAQRARRVSEEAKRVAEQAIMGDQITYSNGGVYNKTDPASLVAVNWGKFIPPKDEEHGYKEDKHRSTDPASLVAGIFGKVGLGKIVKKVKGTSKKFTKTFEHNFDKFARKTHLDKATKFIDKNTHLTKIAKNLGKGKVGNAFKEGLHGVEDSAKVIKLDEVGKAIVKAGKDTGKFLEKDLPKAGKGILNFGQGVVGGFTSGQQKQNAGVIGGSAQILKYAFVIVLLLIVAGVTMKMRRSSSSSSSSQPRQSVDAQ